ncbi:MAG: hypothetical protein JO170_33140 [Verrucomicrobia bacterium]|nr:hypothetical protein [Verrucomicrobiota bacterium]
MRNLASFVQEVQRWEWVATNTLELNVDRFAREEVSRQKSAALWQLERRIQSHIGLRQFTGQMTLDWYCGGEPLEIRDGRRLVSVLSDIFDRTYDKSPRIHNELVNRQSLSSASAAARMRLIRLMFTNGHSEWLGLDPAKKPPEMSIYLSVLKNTGLHTKRADSWRIGEPHPQIDAKCRLLPTLHRIREILQEKPDTRVNISALFGELRMPPYGVRNGVMPLLLTVFALSHEKDVAFYKDGTFVRELDGETMLLLTKAPERFDIQYCEIEGVRAEVFERLLAVLEVKTADHRSPELLDLVKSLCVFVAQLPNYVLNTNKLSKSALAVRDTIREAREPSRLLFTDLPKACGFEPIVPNSEPAKGCMAFVKTLKSALDDLRAGYPEMQERLRGRLREAFDGPGTFQQFRATLATRSERVLLGAAEPGLRAFCLRLIDDSLPESDWLESIGSYLALKPPSKWHDGEEDLFNNELAAWARRFRRVESIVFATGKLPSNSVGVRLAVTQANGLEHEEVFHYTAEEEHRMIALQKRFKELFNEEGRLAFAAASQAIWTSLEERAKSRR